MGFQPRSGPIPGARALGTSSPPVSPAFVHVTPSLSRLAGGLFESVRHLSQTVQALSHATVTVIGVHDSQTTRDIHSWAPLNVRTVPAFGPRRFGYSPRLLTHLKNSQPALVHLHGLWRYASIAVSRWARLARRPYIVSPHGMLEPWALAQSPWKKRCALRLYLAHSLRQAACLRATSAPEASAIRNAGFSNPIALVPNGVHCPSLLPIQRPQTRRRALFLSRIHPKKGLLHLLRAWALLNPPLWELFIVGPDEAGHRAQAQRLAHSLGLDHAVHFLDELWGDAKIDLFLQAHLFVLPSFSENFGLVIAEALAYGLPVITTQATPWQELHEHHCGWWIQTGIDPLVRALRHAFALHPAHLRDMGRRGHHLVKHRYSWEPIGQKMLEVYEWMLSHRNQPDYVFSP